MKTVLLAIGSRGDVLPHVHLAARLRDEGHRACVATLDDHRSLVTDAGVEFVALAPGLDFADTCALNTPQGRAQFESPMGALKTLKSLVKDLAPSAAPALDELVEPGDVVLTGVLGAGTAWGLRKTRNCQVVLITFAATVPTSDGPSYVGAPFPQRHSVFNGWASRGAHRLFTELTLAPGRALTQQHGTTLSVSEVNRGILGSPTLVATSPLLAPPAPDWPNDVVVTGAWNPPVTDYTPDPDLAEFLANGPAPVYIGFGSCVTRDPAHQLRTFAEATAASGVRAVIRASDWLSPQAWPTLPDHVRIVTTVPHEWLFPRMAAVVHHGGAGTTLAALRAGVPSSIVWQNFDQPFHARRCATIGVGPLGFSSRKLTVARLQGLITGLVDVSAGYRERAQEVAQTVKAEDGLAAVVRKLDEWQGR